MGKTFALRVGALRAIAEDRMVVTEGRMVVTEKCPIGGSLSGTTPVSMTKCPDGGSLSGIRPVSTTSLRATGEPWSSVGVPGANQHQGATRLRTQKKYVPGLTQNGDLHDGPEDP